MPRSRFARLAVLAATCVLTVSLMGANRGAITKLTLDPNAPVVDLFDGVDQEQFDVRLVAQSANQGKIFITNKTDKPLTVSIPKGLVGLQVLAQPGNMFGQGLGMNGNGMGMGMNGGGQNGGTAQNVGGNAGPIGQQNGTGFPGGGGNQFPGNGQGFFSVPPEKTVMIALNSVCLNYGRREPHAGMKYKLAKAVGSPGTELEFAL